MTRRRSTHAGMFVTLVLIGAACGRESSDGAPGGVSSSGGSLGAAGAHEHGVARVNVAVEDDGAVIEFFAPGQSIYGFEGEPRTAEQEAARAEGIERLKERIPQMFAFDPSLDCRFGSPRIELEDDEHAEGEHHEEGEAHEGDEAHEDEHQESHEDDDEHDEAHESEHADEDQHDEVHAEVEVQCARSPVGTDLRLAVTESFPDIVQIDLQVLSAARQSGARVAASGHVVTL